MKPSFFVYQISKMQNKNHTDPRFFIDLSKINNSQSEPSASTITREPDATAESSPLSKINRKKNRYIRCQDHNQKSRSPYRDGSNTKRGREMVPNTLKQDSTRSTNNASENGRKVISRSKRQYSGNQLDKLRKELTFTKRRLTQTENSQRQLRLQLCFIKQNKIKTAVNTSNINQTTKATLKPQSSLYPHKQNRMNHNVSEENTHSMLRDNSNEKVSYSKLEEKYYRLKNKNREQKRKLCQFEALLKAKESALYQSDQMAMVLIEKLTAQQKQISELKNQNRSHQYSLFCTQGQLDLINKNSCQTNFIEEYRFKCQQIEILKTNLIQELKQFGQYKQRQSELEFKVSYLSNELTKAQLQISQLQQKEKSLKKQVERAKKQRYSLVNQVHYEREKNNQLQAQIQTLIDSKEKLQKQKAQQTKMMREKLEEMNTWFNKIDEDSICTENNSSEPTLTEYPQDIQMDRTQEFSYQNKQKQLKAELQNLKKQSELQKIKSEQILRQVRAEYQFQLSTKNKEYMKQISKYADQIGKLMSQIKRIKGRKSLVDKFEVIPQLPEQS